MTTANPCPQVACGQSLSEGSGGHLDSRASREVATLVARGRCCVGSWDADTVAITRAPAGHSTVCVEPCPQCGYVRAVEVAAELLFAEWDAARTAPQCVASADLAMEFVRDLRRYPDIVALPIRHTWVRAVYPLFCQSRGAVPAPPYKDFARALGQLMPRQRKEVWRRGKRETVTRYRMLEEEPSTNVVVQLTRAAR